MCKDEIIEKLRLENDSLLSRLNDTTKRLEEADLANVRLLSQQKKMSSIFRFIDLFLDEIRETTEVGTLYNKITETFSRNLGLDMSALFNIHKSTCEIETLSISDSMDNNGICKKIPGVSIEDMTRPIYFNDETGSQFLREFFLKHYKVNDFIWYPIEETKDHLLVLMGGKRPESKIGSSFSPMALEAMGAISSAIIVRRDSILKTVDIIRENKEKILLLAEIMKTSSFSVIASDENGDIFYANPATEKLYGYDKNELIGTNVSKLSAMNESEYEKLKRNIVLTLVKGRTWKGEILSKKKNGETLYIRIAMYLLRDDNGAFKAAIAFHEDITDRKNMEKELIAKNRELNDFAYRVSHDLKNPINMIKGFVFEIKENPNLFDDYFNKITYLSDHLIQQINSLLKLSRAGRIIDNKTLIDFEVLIKGIYIPLRDPLVPSELILNTQVEEIRGDPGGIEEVFNNLIHNSINYRDKDKEKLIIDVSCVNNGGNNHIRFRDNGRGIDKIFLSKLFSPGFTLKSERGTGFGLAIVKKIIEAHGGTIEVFSEGENKGAEFVITLPE